MHKNRATSCRGHPGEAPRHVCVPHGKHDLRSLRGLRGSTQNGTPDFTEDDVTWVASKLSGAEGELGAYAIELRNRLLRFSCASKELRVIVARLANWMHNSSTPWDAYHAIMACRLVALNKWPGVRPVGIGETLLRDLAKLFMRAAGVQAKTVYGNLQLCADLEASIEGATHAVGQRRIERVRGRRCEEGEAEDSAEEEEESWVVVQAMNNIFLTVD